MRSRRAASRFRGRIPGIFRALGQLWLQDLHSRLEVPRQSHFFGERLIVGRGASACRADIRVSAAIIVAVQEVD